MQNLLSLSANSTATLGQRLPAVLEFRNAIEAARGEWSNERRITALNQTLLSQRGGIRDRSTR